MKRVEVRHANIVHEDERRAIIELFNGGTIKQIKILKVKKDSILGNHYHNFPQFFYILEGAGVYYFKNVKTGEETHVHVKRGDYIKIGAFIAHAAKLLKGTVTLEGNAQKYKGKEDDIPYKLV